MDRILLPKVLNIIKRPLLFTAILITTLTPNNLIRGGGKLRRGIVLFEPI